MGEDIHRKDLSDVEHGALDAITDIPGVRNAFS